VNPRPEIGRKHAHHSNEVHKAECHQQEHTKHSDSGCTKTFNCTPEVWPTFLQRYRIRSQSASAAEENSRDCDNRKERPNEVRRPHSDGRCGKDEKAHADWKCDQRAKKESTERVHRWADAG